MLDKKTIDLLDKLYNLRDEDSVILKQMDEEKNVAVETKERTAKETTELANKIDLLSNEEDVLATEGENLKRALATVDSSSFSIVIEKLGLDFKPEELEKEVSEKLPETISEIQKEILDAKEKLVNVEEEMNEAITKIEELGIRRDEALANQERLNRYFELSLSSNINITRDEITSLLSQFNFTDDEQREAAKIMMFPEDGLFEYEKRFSDAPVADLSIGKIIQDAKEEVPDVKVEEETFINNEPLLKDEAEENFVNINYEEPSFDKEELNLAVADKKEEKSAGKTKEDVINLLLNLDFDYLDFTNNSLEKIVDNYDEDTIRYNTKLINSININRDVFYDNVELLYDKELESKISILTNVGKLPNDIYLNSNILVKYNLDELNHAIKLLEESGLEPKNVPLMAY